MKYSLKIASALVALAGAAAVGTAQARTDVHWSVGINAAPGITIGASNGFYAPAPVYYAPAPVYYEPAPVYYYPPPARVYYSTPVYYGPTVVVRSGHRHHRHHRGHRH